MHKKLLILLCLCYVPVLSAQQITQREKILHDPIMEQQAQEIFANLRCLVCQGQSVGDSDADMARDFRNIVRSLLEEGQNTQQIFGFFRERYGDFVLLSPPLESYTIILWVMPILVLIIVSGALIYWYHQQKQALTDTPSWHKAPIKSHDIIMDNKDNKKSIMFISVGIILLLFILSIVSYLQMGSPSYDDQPLAKRHEMTIQAYQQAIANDPNNIELKIIYARYLRSLNNDLPNIETTALMRDVLALDKNHQEALWFLGLASLENNKEKARDYFQQLLAIIPTDDANYHNVKNNIDKLLQ